MMLLVQLLQDLLIRVNEESLSLLRSIHPLLLASGTALVTYVFLNMWNLHRDNIGIRRRVMANLFSVVKKIPWIRRNVEAEISRVSHSLAASLHENDGTEPFLFELPEIGISPDRIIKLTDTYSNLQGPRYLDGKVSGAVFNNESNMDEIEVYVEVFKRFAWSNPLWPKLFPGVRKMEAEVIRMCCSLMHGDNNSCGTMSTGGTISILLACLAHRNRALQKGIIFPEMVLPTSAHAAFTKAAELFRIKTVKISIDPVTFKVNIDNMKKAINKRTCMLVGSAPNFPFGTIDDIQKIGRLGLKYDIPVHVDACVGGFLLPFINGSKSFDFSVPGVCSISADTHKYGLAPKGSSVILYKSKDYLHNQYFCDPDWQGGIYASATLEGSRSGLNIALCWASLIFHGINNYKMYAKTIIETATKIKNGIMMIPELKIQGNPDVCIISWTSDVIDIKRLYDMIIKRGWHLTNLQHPSGMHIMVTINHTGNGIAESLIKDIKESVQEITADPKALLYSITQIPDRLIVQKLAFSYLDACYASALPL